MGCCCCCASFEPMNPGRCSGCVALMAVGTIRGGVATGRLGIGATSRGAGAEIFGQILKQKMSNFEKIFEILKQKNFSRISKFFSKFSNKKNCSRISKMFSAKFQNNRQFSTESTMYNVYQNRSGQVWGHTPEQRVPRPHYDGTPSDSVWPNRASILEDWTHQSDDVER